MAMNTNNFSVNIKDFGAIANGKTLNTVFIQSAIDECEKRGGGRVIIPKGKFLTGTIYLKDNVSLYLSKNATLIASTNLDDYNSVDLYPQNFSSIVEKWVGKHLILALEKSNVAILGKGKIDGNANFFFEKPKKLDAWFGYLWRYGFAQSKSEEIKRPGQLICFIECSNVTVSDITIKNSTCWSCFFHGCNEVKYINVKVRNKIYHANTDGVDIDCCKNALIENCDIKTGDDGLAIRCDSQRLKNPKPCSNITIKNCKVTSAVSGVRIGVGKGEITGVKIDGLKIKKCGIPVLIQTRYGNKEKFADISNIDITNLTCEDAGYPITLTGDIGSITNFTLQNSKINCLAGVKIIAKETCDISNINLSNLSLFFKKEKVKNFTDSKLNARGSHFIEISGTNTVNLNGVIAKANKRTQNDWSGTFIEQNNQNLTIKNSNI